jgi:hypothetical protein
VKIIDQVILLDFLRFFSFLGIHMSYISKGSFSIVNGNQNIFWTLYQRFHTSFKLRTEENENYSAHGRVFVPGI